MSDVLTQDEQETYRSGVIDCLRGRESMSALLGIVRREDLQIAYIRGWLVGERLLDDEDPFGGIDEDDEDPFDLGENLYE